MATQAKSIQTQPFAAGGTSFFAKVTKSTQLGFSKTPFQQNKTAFCPNKTPFYFAETPFYFDTLVASRKKCLSLPLISKKKH